MSNVHPIYPEKATPQQILAQAYAQAQAGDIRDVVIVYSHHDGGMKIAHAWCEASDLAVAALVVEAEARKALKIEG